MYAYAAWNVFPTINGLGSTDVVDTFNYFGIRRCPTKIHYLHAMLGYSVLDNELASQNYTFAWWTNQWIIIDLTRA